MNNVYVGWSFSEKHILLVISMDIKVISMDRQIKTWRDMGGESEDDRDTNNSAQCQKLEGVPKLQNIFLEAFRN